MNARRTKLGLLAALLALAVLGTGCREGALEPVKDRAATRPSQPQSAPGVTPGAALPAPGSELPADPLADLPAKTRSTPGEPGADPATTERTMEKVEKSDAEWRELLSPEQYHILREAGTERAFTGKYWNTKTKGTYRCAACGLELFTSDAKFDSGCGWPSFFEAKDGFHITEHEDTSYGMRRVEVRCRKCESHLGHVFPDGPEPTGLRYCINSACIELVPAEAPASDTGKTGKGEAAK